MGFFSKNKRFLVQNQKICDKILQPWNSNRPSTNISNLESRDTSTHGGESEQTNLLQRSATCEPFWKARELDSRILFCAQRFLFARHSEKLAISIREPLFECSVFYSRDIRKSSRSLFARLPLPVCAEFSICEPFWRVRELYSCVFFERCVLFFLGVFNGTYQL